MSHWRLTYKLRHNGISGNLRKHLKSFLGNRKKRVVLNGQFSNYANVNAKVPKGSILGPLLFLIYIKDLPKNLQSNPDNISLFLAMKDPQSTAEQFGYDLDKLNRWVFRGK